MHGQNDHSPQCPLDTGCTRYKHHYYIGQFKQCCASLYAPSCLPIRHYQADSTYTFFRAAIHLSVTVFYGCPPPFLMDCVECCNRLFNQYGPHITTKICQKRLNVMRSTITFILGILACSTVVMARDCSSDIDNNMVAQTRLSKQETVTLIVDPFSSGALIAGELAKYHRSCVAILSTETFPSFMLASYSAKDFIQVFTFTGDIDKLAQDIDAKYHVEAVITGAESGVLLTDQLANRYQTIGNNLATSVARRDKFAIQQRIEAAQLRTIPSLVTDRFDEVVAWTQQQSLEYSHGYIVKPIRSAGTDHVKCCKDLDAIKSALDALLGTKDILGNSNEKALVQCFVKGEEYVADAVSIDGQPIITGVLKYNKLKTDEGHLLYNTMDFVSKDTFPEKDIVAYTKKSFDSVRYSERPFTPRNYVCTIWARIDRKWRENARRC